MTEIPSVSDLVSVFACYLLASFLKWIPWSTSPFLLFSLLRFGIDGKQAEKGIRRMLPVVILPAFGALVRVAVEAMLGGQDWQTAMVRGVIAGAASVYAQSSFKAMVMGDVGKNEPKPSRPKPVGVVGPEGDGSGEDA